MSKVNTIGDMELRRAKSVIYNNTALNVFLYNLPENMVRIVRLKSPTTLEAALSIVLEEVNFLDQYKMRNRIHGNIQNSESSSRSSTQPVGNKPTLTFHSKFNENNPQNIQVKIPQTMGQGQAFKPVFDYRPQSGLQPQQFGYRPPLQFGYRPPQHFGYRPPQPFGYRPPQPFGYRPPQPFGYRLPPQLGYKPPQPFGYKPPQQAGSNLPQVLKPQNQNSDVSMRTAQPQQQYGFNLNELTMNDYGYEYDPYYDEFYYYNLTNDYDYANDLNYDYGNESNTNDSNVPNDKLEPINESQNVDFRAKASLEDKKS